MRCSVLQYVAVCFKVQNGVEDAGASEQVYVVQGYMHELYVVEGEAPCAYVEGEAPCAYVKGEGACGFALTHT